MKHSLSICAAALSSLVTLTLVGCDAATVDVAVTRIGNNRNLKPSTAVDLVQYQTQLERQAETAKQYLTDLANSIQTATNNLSFPGDGAKKQTFDDSVSRGISSIRKDIEDFERSRAKLANSRLTKAELNAIYLDSGARLGVSGRGMEKLGLLSESADVRTRWILTHYPDLSRAKDALNPTDRENAIAAIRGSLARENIAVAAKRASDAVAAAADTRQILFGGFQSDSVYLINPGSSDWDHCISLERHYNPTLVFSKTVAVGTGDSTLLFVQETPTQFEMRHLQANPEDSIRNALFVANQIAAAVAVAAPFVGLPPVKVSLPSIGSATTDTTTTPETQPMPPNTASAYLNRLDKEITAAVKSVESIVAGLTSTSTLTNDNKAQLNKAVDTLETAILGSVTTKPGGAAQ